jgi:hypothetical protein
VKLREHPRLLWPTLWVHGLGDPQKRTDHDIGTLIEVVHTNQSPRMLFLVTDFEGLRYMGALLCKDQSLVHEVSGFLTQHRGKPVREIGDLDVTF